MENPLISVIVPIYKVEQYLDKCITSIVNQTYKNLEIILVDDGSPDNCPTLCDKWKELDNRINVIHKENGGVSVARNAGIKVAKGVYISFVDADDTLELNAYDEVVKVINKYEPDIIDFGFKYVSYFGESIKTHNKLSKNVLLTRQYILEYILPPLINLIKDDEKFIYDFLWNKIYRKDIISNNNILLNENRRTWEDRLFIVEFLKHVNSYYSLSEYLYNYMDIPNSLSRRYDLQFFDIIVENYQFYYDNFSEYYNFDVEYVNNYWSKSIENMIYRSLDEIDNKDLIVINIKNVLTNKNVVEWYRKRRCKDIYDEKITQLIVDGNVDKALNLYIKIHHKKLVKKRKKEIIFKVKRLIKKCLFIK